MFLKHKPVRQALSAKAVSAQIRMTRHSSVQKIQTAADLSPALHRVFPQVSATAAPTDQIVPAQIRMKRLNALKPELRVIA